MTRAAPPTCCGKPCELTTGKHLFPSNRTVADRPYWSCTECSAYVGCKPGSTRPLGILCGPELRRARELLDAQRIKPLWENAPWSGGYEIQSGMEAHRVRNTARKRVFDYLADRLRIPRDRCRLEFFDLETCRRAWRALTGVTYPEIREWAHEGAAEAQGVAA